MAGVCRSVLIVWSVAATLTAMLGVTAGVSRADDVDLPGVSLTSTSGAPLQAGGTYGIGEVVVAHFDAPVGDRGAAEQQLTVSTSPPVSGAWHWVDDQTAHWRPPQYSEPGTVPFAVTFDPAGDLVIAEAGPSALATFALHSDGTITQIDAVDTGQSATCWVTAVGGQLFTSNTGSGNLSRFTSDAQGQLTLLGQTTTGPGTVDSSATPDGRFLYVQAGGDGSVDEFSITAGTLTEIGSVTVPGAVGGEGIAAA